MPAPPSDDSQPRYFKSPAELRRWLRKHHANADELLVGLHKVGRAAAGLSWPESVDEALCVGWIDGVRRRVDEDRYCIRFTPRRQRSIWSAVNVRRARALIAAGRMQPAGRATFDARQERRTAVYSYERAPAVLPAPLAREFRRQQKAWAFFAAQAPSYCQKCLAWVAGAKQVATRDRRLQRLIAASAAKRRL